ncbi:formate dehydrogenase accessory sulfurtransferase FdhD [Pedobacter sp. 22163]|uniref:formate dehydrogenase accessory sulfurtransferase FdhD n=1 Tax=Pedobacter sp. 22163 TaxID=3453883 RepID=UPI003F870FD9
MMNTESIANHPTVNIGIKKFHNGHFADMEDVLAIEEPLEIRLAYGPVGDRNVSNISVTMRTPGSDEELAIGFLFTEGIISGREQISQVAHLFIACRENKQNTILVDLSENAIPRLPEIERSFYTTSSCGVCGKGSIEAIRTVGNAKTEEVELFKIDIGTLIALPERLRAEQMVFRKTGGLHACAFFDRDGRLLLVREDVGRHNALDKLIGAGLENGTVPMDNGILMLSGRASFELIQKAVMAGIKIVVAVGAPSSLAVELSKEFNITLIGFIREDRFNIYASPERIIFE